MAKVNVQVRGVEGRVVRALKARAAEQGLSLSELLRRELELLAELPSGEQRAELISALPSLAGRGLSAVDLVSETRRRGS